MVTFSVRRPDVSGTKIAAALFRESVQVGGECALNDQRRARVARVR